MLAYTSFSGRVLCTIVTTVSPAPINYQVNVLFVLVKGCAMMYSPCMFNDVFWLLNVRLSTCSMAIVVQSATTAVLLVTNIYTDIYWVPCTFILWQAWVACGIQFVKV